MSRLLIAAAFLILMSVNVRADEPKKMPEAEKIPAPKAKVEPAYSIVPYAPRTDTREVWQHYGVNSSGRFVPRVIVLPFGAYYSRDLQPFPWTTSRQTAVLPLVVD